MLHSPEKPAGFSLASVGLALSAWFERWFPDAFALALAACAIVFVASLGAGASPADAAQWFGAGFWDLVAFTMQIALIIVTGYVVAVSPPVYRVVTRIAALPKSGPSAAAFVGLFSMVTSLLSWSFSLIFSGLLAREVAHRVSGTDYRAVGAAAYLGIGSVWALGLSSSAALIMASPASLPDSIEAISGVIPLGQTLGLWQSVLMAAVVIVLSMIICYYSAPSSEQARSMAEMGVTYAPPPPPLDKPDRPGEWLEYSPVLTLLVCARLFRPRSRDLRRGDHPRAESLCVRVPGRRNAPALAAAIVRAGSGSRGAVDRRRARSVPDLRRHRPHDD
jgi:short-chain fatty acids transporter